MMIRTLSVAAAGLCLSTAASAVVVADFDFNTPGDTEGFFGQGTSPLTVAGGTLNGTATNTDPQLRHPDAVVVTAGEQFDTFSAVVRELDADGNVVQGDNSVAFNPDGLILIFDFSVSPFFNFGAPDSVSDADENGFRTLNYDLSAFNREDSGFIRFDPIGSTTGNTFQVDSITVTDTAPIPEPASLALLGLGGLALLGRRSR